MFKLRNHRFFKLSLPKACTETVVQDKGSYPLKSFQLLNLSGNKLDVLLHVSIKLQILENIQDMLLHHWD
jgi:hypothetical protein